MLDSRARCHTLCKSDFSREEWHLLSEKLGFNEEKDYVTIHHTEDESSGNLSQKERDYE